MAEAARRTGYGHGSDVVRRLIARPIRLQTNAAAMPAHARQPLSDAAPLTPAEDRADTAGAGGADRHRTEVLLLKAVLQAERRENASLRACLGVADAEADMHPEARAVRDRWAVLMDRLLRAPA